MRPIVEAFALCSEIYEDEFGSITLKGVFTDLTGNIPGIFRFFSFMSLNMEDVGSESFEFKTKIIKCDTQAVIAENSSWERIVNPEDRAGTNIRTEIQLQIQEAGKYVFEFFIKNAASAEADAQKVASSSFRLNSPIPTGELHASPLDSSVIVPV